MKGAGVGLSCRYPLMVIPFVSLTAGVMRSAPKFQGGVSDFVDTVDYFTKAAPRQARPKSVIKTVSAPPKRCP
jgi:hypothetical protein